jgi:cephalosporin hydroxylase
MTLAEHAARTVDMVPHLGTLARLARDARTVVEFGVRTGVSTWALLEGLPPDGRMVSVDIVEVEVPPEVREDPRWSFVQGDDREASLPAAQLVLIDTSHEYHHTLGELRIAQGLGAERIALHDWNLPDVEDAALRFMREAPYRLWLLEPSEWGLAVLAR